MSTRTLVRSLSICLLVGALPLAAHAQDVVSRQAGTAAAHAGMALGSPDLATTHTHLHHVINCLVGPGGAGFDAGAANPCKGMGHGAIPDAQADAAMTVRLKSALKAAEQGAQASTLDDAHADAKRAMTLLQSK